MPAFDTRDTLLRHRHLRLVLRARHCGWLLHIHMPAVTSASVRVAERVLSQAAAGLDPEQGRAFAYLLLCDKAAPRHPCRRGISPSLFVKIGERSAPASAAAGYSLLITLSVNE